MASATLYGLIRLLSRFFAGRSRFLRLRVLSYTMSPSLKAGALSALRALRSYLYAYIKVSSSFSALYNLLMSLANS